MEADTSRIPLGADVNQIESRHILARYATVHAVMAGAAENVRWLLGGRIRTREGMEECREVQYVRAMGSEEMSLGVNILSGWRCFAYHIAPLGESGCLYKGSSPPHSPVPSNLLENSSTCQQAPRPLSKETTTKKGPKSEGQQQIKWHDMERWHKNFIRSQNSLSICGIKSGWSA